MQNSFLMENRKQKRRSVGTIQEAGYLSRIVCILLCFISISFSQNYEDYLASDTSFIDTFPDNDTNWVIDSNTNGYCKILKVQDNYGGIYGDLIISSNSRSSCMEYWITHIIDTTKDFEIESEISGENCKVMNLIWGKDNKSGKYCFQISTDYQFAISYYNGSWIQLKDWTSSDIIHSRGYNKLTIRKIGNKYWFFLNEKLVFNCKFYPFFGNQIGYQTDNLLYVKNLKVLYLKRNPKPPRKPYLAYDSFLKTTHWGGSFGLGYMHSVSEIWKDGFDLDILLGYRFLPLLGFECGFDWAYTGIASEKKAIVPVVNTTTGSTGIDTTAGGNYYFWPIGLKFILPIFDRKYLTFASGAEYCFESESGISAEDYKKRRSPGFGYYARISFHLHQADGPYRGLGWGFQIRYTMNNANVGDFYKDADGLVTKSHSPDERIVFLVEIGGL
jgi:hypothetical protein